MKKCAFIQVTCGILEQQDRVLITQRSLRMAQPGLWEFPGGKIEAGEEEETCLVREIQEELQLVIQPIRRMTPVVHDFGTHKIELIPYLCSYLGGTLQLTEHMAFRWASLPELGTVAWCPADVPVVTEYLQMKKFNK